MSTGIEDTIWVNVGSAAALGEHKYYIYDASCDLSSRLQALTRASVMLCSWSDDRCYICGCYGYFKRH